MKERCRQIAAHTLPQTELSHGDAEEWLEVQQRDELIACRQVLMLRHPIDVAEQFERFRNREIPPELRTLTEDHPDICHMGDAVAPRNATKHVASAAVRDQNSCQRFY